MKLREPLNFAGRLYDAGESVKGQLPLDMIEALRNNNKLDEGADETEAEAIDQTQGDINPDNNGGLADLGNLPIVGNTIISPEDFKELSAPDQKDRLKALEIEPASKAEDRLEQYETWYFEQVANADPNAQ
ncbi:hypothetical protein [Paenibacillus sp. DMB20]|uniref:hypothetical protein n=1 Tax=Paenibacillus sp. DMB20 TaxID=1642570 RepID=UPI00062789D3|nr:hypothetical protein [Paenibacillus sp. DMB20]KKO51968.1 hypothetical protein XI25_21015 [Paenibacillus sp. DMB20]